MTNQHYSATPIAKYALALAKHGWRVFPLHAATRSGCSCGRQDCPAPGKHPRIQDWQNEATDDPQIIKEWWQQWPYASIGIATGAKSNAVVLDVDKKSGGLESLRLLEKSFGPLPDGPRVRTGGGGLHIYFEDPRIPIRSRSGAVTGYPGLDFKGNGGYVVAPPSMHASGKRYLYLTGKTPSSCPLPVMPKWLIEKLQEKSVNPRGLNTPKVSQVIAAGMRNSTLASLAGMMRARGMTQNAIEGALIKVNQRRCKPPLGDAEVLQIAASIASYPTGSKVSQTNQLISLVTGQTLFHDPSGDAYASVDINGHREIWAVLSRGFKDYLRWKFHQNCNKAPNSTALNDAISAIAASAKYADLEHLVFTRIAEKDGSIYLDLANKNWEAVKIDEIGWEVVSEPPVRFVRRRNMLALPVPERGGRIEQLWDFANVREKESRVLVLAFLVAALRPHGPYPVLVLHGEHGSAKSTLARVLRELIDPNKAPLRAEPRDARDLIIAASNSWIVNFDNLSRLPIWLSDALCRLATGGGFGTRELYTDAEEVLFDAQRPIIINGIEELAVRADLLDRSLILYLQQIPPTARKQEEDVLAEFKQARPRLLGALLDAVSTAIRRLPEVHLPALPRMADFATWAVAAKPAFGYRGVSFLKAYRLNRDSANELALESSSVADVLKEWVASDEWKPFRGRASTLLRILNDTASDDTKREISWPKNARSLSNRLRQLVPNLRAIGIEVEFGGQRIIRITKKRVGQ